MAREDREIERILEALKNERVRQALLQLVEYGGFVRKQRETPVETARTSYPSADAQELTRLRTENAHLRQKLASAETENDGLRRLLDKAEQERGILQGERLAEAEKQKTLLDSLEKLRHECERLQDQVKKQKDQNDMFERYLALPEEVRGTLGCIFKREDAQVFIACGVQRDNLEALWDVAKQRIMEGRMQETQTLAAMFRFFLALYNSTSDEPAFALQETEPGMEFSTREHILCPGSARSGVISEVLLPGYVSRYTGEIQRKAIVRI